MGPTLRKKRTADEGSDGRKAGKSTRKWMSVKEMGDLLGLRKTDRYWLVHKNYFETETLYGKMRVNIQSFEKWYANQIKYRKVTGEEPGLELKAWSLSPRDISELLEIPEYRVYELIKEKNWETVTVDYWTRVRRDSFMTWYQGQKHYRTREDRQRDQELEESTITFPHAAAMIGLTRNQFYPLLKNHQYAPFFDIVEIAGRRRVTKESFQRFLEGQDQYTLVDRNHPGEGANGNAGETADAGQIMDLSQTPYLTIAEAARLAGISRQMMSRFVNKGHFGKCRRGSLIRIPTKAFTEWMEKRKEEILHGID